MIGWISLGYAPTYIALEIEGHKLARSVSVITSVKSKSDKIECPSFLMPIV